MAKKVKEPEDKKEEAQAKKVKEPKAPKVKKEKAQGTRTGSKNLTDAQRKAYFGAKDYSQLPEGAEAKKQVEVKGDSLRSPRYR